MKERPVTFTGKGEQIIGVLHLPASLKPPLVVFLHGWGQEREETTCSLL